MSLLLSSSSSSSSSSSPTPWPVVAFQAWPSIHCTNEELRHPAPFDTSACIQVRGESILGRVCSLLSPCPLHFFLPPREATTRFYFIFSALYSFLPPQVLKTSAILLPPPPSLPLASAKEGDGIDRHATTTTTTTTTMTTTSSIHSPTQPSLASFPIRRQILLWIPQGRGSRGDNDTCTPPDLRVCPLHSAVTFPFLSFLLLLLLDL